MPSKFCLDCRALFTVEPGGSASRCPPCQAGVTTRMNSRPKANTTARGLGAAHRAKAKAVVEAAQVCALCGMPPTPGDPLTAHHTQARAKGGQDSPMVAAHRSCNSRVGDRT